MITTSFKTRTVMQAKPHPVINDDTWGIALDMGYSGVKNISRSFVSCFPAYARVMPKNAVELARPLPTDIFYRDNERSDVWAVGEKANSMISIESTNDSNAVLYGRNRYFSDIFRVTSRTSMALALTANEFGSPNGKKIKVQTGLPPKYMDTDKDLLREALSGDFSYDIKVGSGDWQHFEYSLSKDDIHITQQPMGTMVSLAINKDGKPTPDAEKLFHSNILVFDPGFRTGDCCLIKKGTVNPEECQTFSDLSMIEVLERTSREIADKYGVHIPVSAIQPVLETGMVKAFDKKTLRSKSYDISDILAKCNDEVCDAAIARLCEIYNYFQEVDYLAVTGGTGAAWMGRFHDRLRGLETLNILPGNRNEDIPYIFANARGYYMYLINNN